MDSHALNKSEIPLGHTRFSWQNSSNVPLSHTRYSWGPSVLDNADVVVSSSTSPTTTTTPQPPLTLVDVDANFLHDDLENHIEWHLSQAATAQPWAVTKFVTPCCCFQDLTKIKTLGERYPDTIYVTAGVHPYWSASHVGTQAREGGWDCTPLAEAQLREMASQNIYRCIGECGLDCVRPPTEANGFPTLETQLPWFEAQVRIAVDLQKPLFLHERKAHKAFLNVLDPYLGDCVGDGTTTTTTTTTTARLLPPCLVHAFSGTEPELIAYRKRDFYIGVTGHLFDKSSQVRACLVKHVPLNRLMVETDAPYMGFKGCRLMEKKETMVGTRVYKNRTKDKYPNVPAALPRIVALVAELYGVTGDEVARATSNNAHIFFQMNSSSSTQDGNRDTTTNDTRHQELERKSEGTTDTTAQDNDVEAINDMAQALQDQQELEQAVALYLQVLAIRERTLGREHPTTLTACWNVGIVYQDLGELSHAEPLLLRTVQGYTTVLGSAHPDTLTTMYNVADFYETKGDYESAVRWSRTSLEGYASIDYVEDVQDGCDQLCAFLNHQGRHEEADGVVLKYLG